MWILYVHVHKKDVIGTFFQSSLFTSSSKDFSNGFLGDKLHFFSLLKCNEMEKDWKNWCKIQQHTKKTIDGNKWTYEPPFFFFTKQKLIQAFICD